MMPDTSHQHAYFIQAIKENDVTGIINSLSNEVFDVNFRDVTHDLETPLMRLCHSGVTDEDLDSVLEVIGQRNPNVDLQDAVGRTLIMHACIALRHQIVVFSLAQGCDASKCDRMGRSAYHYAAESGSDWIMASLLKQPDALTCLKVLDFKGYSPTDLARHRKAHSVVKMISQAMSGNDKNSNPRPLNPKPLQPAFMRSTDFNQSPTKKQVTFNTALGQNDNKKIGSNPSVTFDSQSNAPVPSSRRGNDEYYTQQSKNTTDPSRWEEVDSDTTTEDDDNVDENDDDSNDYLQNDDSCNDDEHLTHAQQTVLSPLKNTPGKQSNHDKLEHFTSKTPIGLIKPRPLPRLLTNPSNDTQSRDNNQDSDAESSHTGGKDDMDTSDNTPEPIPNDSPRKTKAKQTNNIFTLRPPPLNGTNQNRLPAQSKSRHEMTSPNSEHISGPWNLKEPLSSPRKSQNSTKIGLGLAVGSTAGIQNDFKTSPQKQLGPVVSPRKNQYPNGRKVDATELLNDSTNLYNNLKTKFRQNEIDFSSSTGSNSSADIENSNTPKRHEGKRDENDGSQATSNRPNNIPLKNTNRHQPCRMSPAGRRDLEAILSPVPKHRPLLQKRKAPDSMKAQCDAIRDSYTVRDKVSSGDKDYVFEEEILLKSESSSSSMGSKKTNEEEKGNRTGSRLTMRRSSISLPDLRDMTGCLVTSQKASRYGILDQSNTSGKRDDENVEDKNIDDDYDDDYDDEDDEDDKAEMDGDKSDDDDNDVDCVLDSEAKSKTVSLSGSNSNKRNKGGNNETPLPSIQITNDPKSSFHSKGRGLAAPWM